MPAVSSFMSHVAYADIGDVHTPNLFGSGYEGVPTSTLREDPDDPHKEHTQSTQAHFLNRVQAALWLMTLRPALVDYLGWILVIKW